MIFFAINEDILTENVSSNTRSKSSFYNPSNPKTVNYGLETLSSLGQKISSYLKEIPPLLIFKKNIKKWITHIVLAGCVNAMCHKWAIFHDMIYLHTLGF